MNQIACFPGKYIQGNGTILLLEGLMEKFGRKAVVLTSPTAKQYLPASYSLPPLTSTISVELFGGECSESELSVFSSRIKQFEANVVVGVGGGKVIDTAKIAADRAGLPVIIVPTIASTDAPCSGCAVTYTVDGIFERVHYQRLNPAVVLVDEAIIAKAPVRFLVAGMGDALATWFEARSCQKTMSENECGGLSTLAGQSIARRCYDVLVEHGLRAKQDHEAGVVSDSLKHIIEATILLSGIGFESGGLAAAHAVHNGLTALPETHAYYHGEKVAFGLLVGLYLAHAPENEIDAAYRFCASIGLPVCLSHVGITDATQEKLMRVAEKSIEPQSSIHHEGAGIQAEQVYQAILKADVTGRRYVR